MRSDNMNISEIKDKLCKIEILEYFGKTTEDFGV